MDISRLGEFSFKLVRAGALESHANVLRRHVGPTKYLANGTQEINLGIGEQVDVYIKYQLEATKEGEEEPSVRAALTYCGAFQYKAPQEETIEALQNVYLQYVLLAQVFPLAQQSWARLVQSVGIRPNESTELGLSIDAEMARVEQEAQDALRAAETP